MTNKIFYVDLKEAKIVSYKDLFKDISELEVLPKYIYSTSYYEVFLNIMASLIYDYPVTVLDSDLTQRELEEIVPNSELTVKHILKNKIKVTNKNFLRLLKKTKKWENPSLHLEQLVFLKR
jgi:hypothetical protein